MPINARPEFFKAQGEYANAKTRAEKIRALEEVLRCAPTHKGADHIRAEIKAKIAKLKKQTVRKVGGRMTTIPKEGDAQICIMGLTQSGKSTLLSKMTNAKPKITGRPYTTVKPVIGVSMWQGVQFQMVEIPSTFQRVHMNIAQNCDGIILVLNPKKAQEERKEMLAILEQFRIRKPMTIVKMEEDIDIEEINLKIWEKLNKVRIYCKEPGKKHAPRALVLKYGSDIGDVAEDVHKDFLKFFKFARVWGKSAKHDGQTVGKEHEIADGDIIEIHTI
ncbi:MAG: TGS domain-containing protein [Candidatus Aenigmarchaeota archaeon]|nr:TGS domain-containing protein [Candidatus Aenigmarchaeota archaeon]